jgi:transposase
MPLCRACWHGARRRRAGAAAFALATIYDDGTRSEAARLGNVTLQVVRDWVVRFNAEGPAGLIDRKVPGPKPRLTKAHRRALAAQIDRGPIPAIHGVVRWRAVRSRPMAVGGVYRPAGVACGSRLGPEADAELARDGLTQALGPAAPSCAGDRRHRGVNFPATLAGIARAGPRPLRDGGLVPGR